MSQSTDLAELATPPAGSPFDQIRQERPDGTEYWSGRDLMGLMGYGSWQYFQPVASKAWKGAESIGLGGPDHFMRAHKVAASGPRAADVHLSRLACYLVAMAADESKPRVAEAKLYFAVQTRRQEVGALPARELTRRELLEMALEAEDRADAAKAEALKLGLVAIELGDTVRELRPKAKGYDKMVSTEGVFTLAQSAALLDTGRQRLIAELHRMRVIMVRPGHSDHLRPYQHHITTGRCVVKVGEVEIEHKDGTKETLVTGTTHLTPKGLDYVREMRRVGILPVR